MKNRNLKFKPFKAFVPQDFRDKMVQYWVDNEGYKTKKEALSVYGGDDFNKFCNSLTGKTCTFIPDLGYWDNDINGTLCFEKKDNNFVIPISILCV